MFRWYAPPIHIQTSTYDNVLHCVERRTASPIRKYNWRLITLLQFANVGEIFLLKVLLSIWSGGVEGKGSWLVFSWNSSKSCYLHDHVSVSLTPNYSHIHTHTHHENVEEHNECFNRDVKCSGAWQFIPSGTEQGHFPRGVPGARN